MKKTNKFVKVPVTICPRVTDVMTLYPWHSVILTDYDGWWYVFEDTDHAIHALRHNSTLHMVY